MRKLLLTLMAAFAVFSLAAEVFIIGNEVVYDHGIDAPLGDYTLKDGGSVTAPWQRFVKDGGNFTLTMEPGSAIIATAGDHKFAMPCDKLEHFGICLGYGPGYVVANLGGGVIECTNALFCVAKEAYTTCMVTGTVIRCRGFRLRAGKGSGYATFILGPGGELVITGEDGLRSYHDPDIQTNYEVGDPDFRYYFEMRGGKIRFEGGYNHPGRGDLDHAPCLIMAPDTVSEFEVVGDDNVVHYAGQLQGEGTLRKTGTGKLILASGFIHNEGDIILEEGSMEMYMPQEASLFWGGLIMKPGTRLILLGNDAQDVPDLIQVCRSGMITVEDGAEVWYKNQKTGVTTLVDLTANATNGGYIENRSTYRVGVSMNLGTLTWAFMKDELDDPLTGAYPEHASKWGRMREIKNALGKATVSDIMRIYARSDIKRYIKMSVWAGDCAAVLTSGDTVLSNGNMRVTNYFLDDGFAGMSSKTPGIDLVTAVNFLYEKETVELPAPPCARNWQVQLAEIPYSEFSLYLIFSANSIDANHPTEFAPVKIRLTSPDGLHQSVWADYTYQNGITCRSTANWGGTEGLVSRTNLVEGVNYLRVHLDGEVARQLGLNGLEDLSGCTVDIAPGPVSSQVVGGQTRYVRCCLAGLQIVPDGEPLPELDINEYTAFTADQNIYFLRDDDPIDLHFTATNENSVIGFVHSISNDIHIAPRVLVGGREYPQYPGELSRYEFSARNTDKIKLDVKYLPWRDNQTNDLTMAQFNWVTNRWGGTDELSVSNRTLNSAAAIAGADSDGDDFQFQYEYVTDSDLTKDSNPQHLVIVGRAISNDCLWLDVEYTRTENGAKETNALGRVVHGWLGRTNGCDNAEFLQLGMRRGGSFHFTNDVLRAYRDTDDYFKELGSKWRGPNPVFEHSITNTICLPLGEVTNRYFRAVMEAK